MSESTRGTKEPTFCKLPIQYDPEKPMQVGGQAVMEGVMMRAPGAVATAVRKPNGEIVVKRQAYQSWAEKFPIFKTPILRGAAGLIEMMILGLKTLNWSADIAMEAEVKEKNEKKPSEWSLYLTLFVALALGISLFFITPILITSFLIEAEQNALGFNLISGAIRITLLLAYMWGISFMPDIFRLFQYHGAEHKSIFAFEEEQSVELDRARTYTTYHPRCGTSFLLIVMVVSILSFSIFDSILISILGSISTPLRIATHLPLIPIIGGVSYEVIKFSARHTDTAWGKVLVAPGLWLQKITTKEPDDAQLEVALVALKSALGLDPQTLAKDEETTYERTLAQVA